MKVLQVNERTRDNADKTSDSVDISKAEWQMRYSGMEIKTGA